MKKYKIDRERNIGNVIFVVEGGRPETGGTELRLLKRIFADILGYEVDELRRGTDEFIAHGNNSNYHVLALNLPKNQLTTLDEESLDNLYARIKEEFLIKPEDCPVFFLYDRDVLSYKKNELRKKYIQRYTDPYGNEEGYQGQLLMSYPAVESYLMSCREEDVYTVEAKLGKEIKQRISSTKKGSENILDYYIPAEYDISKKRIIHSIHEMDKGLAYMGISKYDIDNLESVLLDVYDFEQKKYSEDDKMHLFSLIGMAFLELGIIAEE